MRGSKYNGDPKLLGRVKQVKHQVIEEKWVETCQYEICVHITPLREVHTNTNLGIWFSGINGIFKTHVKKPIKKAKKLKGVIKSVTANTYQRAGVATKLWD